MTQKTKVIVGATALLIVMSPLCWRAERARSDGEAASPAHGSGSERRDRAENLAAISLPQIRERVLAAPSAEIEKLKADPSDSIALRAAWEQVRRPLPENIDPNKEYDRSATGGVPLRGVEKFVGFVEGRLRVSVPAWWASELIKGRAWLREWLILLLAYDDLTTGWKQLHKLAQRDIPTTFGTVAAVGRDAGTDCVVVSWGKRRLRLSTVGFHDNITKGSREGWSSLIAGNRCLIAHYESTWVLPLAMYCFDIDDSRLLWTSTIAAGRGPYGPTIFAGGGSTNEVSLVCGHDTVFVFGMEISLAYIEALRLSDGHSVMRFNTSY